MSDCRTILTVDIGNTAMKVAVFEGERLIQSLSGPVAAPEVIETMLTFNSPDGASYCCVGRTETDIPAMLREEFGLPVVEVTPEIPLPIEIDYGTRDTLGPDRVAAAVGTYRHDGAVLVADVGTAVTSDIIVGATFMGGNISPGLRLRFESLHHYTSNLPLINAEGFLDDFGRDTETAIRSGVVNGLLAQLENDYRNAEEKFENLRMVLTGGDAPFLASLLQRKGINVILDPDAVGRGLVRIFNYNTDL